MKKLVLDLDMGVDDAMALAYAMASPEAELIGITTVFGNVPCAQSVAELLGRARTPRPSRGAGRGRRGPGACGAGAVCHDGRCAPAPTASAAVELPVPARAGMGAPRCRGRRRGRLSAGCRAHVGQRSHLRAHRPADQPCPRHRARCAGHALDRRYRLHGRRPHHSRQRHARRRGQHRQRPRGGGCRPALGGAR